MPTARIKKSWKIFSQSICKMDTSTAATLKLLQQKEQITAYLRRSGNPLASAAFPNIFIWQDFFDFKAEMLEGNLCIFASNEVGTFLYAPPLGETISPAATEQCFALMREENRGRPVSRIENVPAARLRDFDEKKYVFTEKSPDYVYRREDLASLKGNPYKTPRWAYNNFVENHRVDFLPYEDSMREACADLYKRWARSRAGRHDDPVYRQMLEDNERVHGRLRQFHKELDLIGRVIRIEGQLAGYTFGFPLNGETFCILCEIIDPDLKGAAVFIFREFCRDEALRPFTFINAMDDSDLPNIRQAKESFHPVERIRNYIITPKE